MDNDEISCNLNHHASNHSRYNKSAHEDHAITFISQSPYLLEEEFNTNRSSPARGKMDFESLSFDLN